LFKITSQAMRSCIDVDLSYVLDLQGDIAAEAAMTEATAGRMDISRLGLASSSTAWEKRAQDITMSNAEQQVPRLLAELKGEARRQAAQAILKSLGRPLRRPERQSKAWVQELMQAAGQQERG
jgi:hypothetical protein